MTHLVARHRARLAAALAVSTLAACSADPAVEAPADAGTTEAAVTWHRDIAPIVARHCQSCHVEGGIAPFALTDYDQAALLAPLMAQRVEEGVMPPWGAVDGDDCAPRFGWKDDPRLSADEQALLRAWADDGAPAGDPATAAPLPEPPSSTLDGVTHRLRPATPYATSGDLDELRCFALDPALTAPGWLTGIDFAPGDLSVVHHAVLTAVPPAGQAELAQEVGPDGSFPCFGGVNVSGSYLLGVWVPGSLPFNAPASSGIPLPAGTTMVLQIHYHPGGVSHDPESTEVSLRIADQAPGKTLFIAGVGNVGTAPILQPDPDDRGQVEFRIPANVDDHTETMTFPISIASGQRLPIVSIFPHMHYVGVQLEATIERATPKAGEPESECLVNSPWNFDWQRTYLYDAPLDQLPTVGDGDQITLRCHYDNTMKNEFVQRGLAEQGLDHPVDVFLGEETLDEMCLVAFGVVL